MKNPSFFIALSAGLSFFAPHAGATNSNVSGPDVREGVAVEWRMGSEYDEDSPDRYQQRLHINYGLSETFDLRLITKQEQREGGHLEYRATDAEIKWQLFEDETDGFDGSVKLAYSMADGDDGADSARLFWLYQISRYGFTFRHNSLLGTQLGSDAEHTPTAEMRWQAMANIWQHHSLGMEMFNNLGAVDDWAGYNAQGHRIGPVLKGKLSEDVSYQTGLLFGISDDAPDIGLKFFIGTRF